MKKMTILFLALILLGFPATLSSQWRDRYDRDVLRGGSSIAVRLPDNLDSDRNRNGDEFEGILDEDLTSGGRVLAPAGSRAIVRLVDVEAGRGRGWPWRRSMVSLTLTGIRVGSSVVPIETDVISVSTKPNPNQRLDFRTQRSMTFDTGYRRRPRELARADDWRSDERSYDHGSFRWRGRVDGSDFVELRGDRVNVRHIKSRPISEQNFDMRTPLPRRPVVVQLSTLQGRGRVELYQQPSASNGYTAVVYIEDDAAGDDIYEFELNW